MEGWKALLLEPAKTIIVEVGHLLVNVFIVVLILFVGWIISRGIKAAVTRGLRGVKLDILSDKVGMDGLLAKGGIKYSLSELMGVLCYWLSMLVTLMLAINAVGLTVAVDLLNRVILYIPNVIAAVFIFVVGIFISNLLKNMVSAAANNAGLSEGRLLSRIVEITVMIFVIALAMDHLNIGARIVELTVGIILASLGLGLAIAIGLGCKDIIGRIAGDFIEKLWARK
ncbi:MAG: hypothetical protein WC583_03785 [Candidatus Omnitrophota bacterium]|jgi:hypothetical protein|nr:hypothetical protein [Candidatus Omnitrophota bacterium]MDD3983434.1 hypothetical protein [Candidatus Omnitrophota bacterium]MDD5526107.1 hypothetical protein [Candidatus Omnitrophota bacterium]